MIFWIGIAAIVLIWPIVGYAFRNDRDGEGFFFGFLIAVVVAVVFFLCVLLPLSAAEEYSFTTLDKQTSSVASLQDNVGSSGSFAAGGFIGFFASGHIGTHLYYTWYERHNGIYRSHTARDSSSTKVRVHLISHSATPRVVHRDYTFWSKVPGWVAPFNMAVDYETATDYWDLYVPRGTIVSDFRLNAK